MTTEQVQQLINLVIQIGGALAEKGFILAHKQVVMEAIADIVALALVLVAMIVGSRIALAMARKHDEQGGFGDDSLLPVVVTIGIAWLFYMVVFILLVTQSIKVLLNPDWYAVKLLMELLK